MFTKIVKIFILSSLISLWACFAAFAETETGNSFPYSVEFDAEPIDRLCYAGHSGATVKYRDGFAVTPDTTFMLKAAEDPEGEYDISRVSVDISLIYENDAHTSSFKETVREYEQGDLNTSESFPLLSENTIASLEEREKLYNDNLKGFVMTVCCDGKKSIKRTLYLYMCSEDDFLDYLMRGSLQ